MCVFLSIFSLFLIRQPHQLVIGILCFVTGVSISLSQQPTHGMMRKPIKSMYFDGIITSTHHKNDHYQTLRLDLKTNHYIKRCHLKYYGDLILKEGDHIIGDGSLYPISNPKTWLGFDFKRYCYLQHIQATGTLKTITSYTSQQHTGLDLYRFKIKEKFLKTLPKDEAAIACALVIGDKSMMSKDIQNVFSNSGLSHILAISGLHMGLMMGFVFLVCRLALSLTPFAQIYNTKKACAIVAMIFGGLYLTISGYGIPAQRSFIMVGIAMIGIIMDRWSLSMRTLSVSAIIILIIQPWSIFSLSFQLSFAAVFGLLVFYESYHVRFSSKIAQFLIDVLLSTSVATIATLPFLISSFQKISCHSFWTNMIAIPLTTFWIMPIGFLTTLCPLNILFRIWEIGLMLLIKIAILAHSMTFGIINFPAPHPLFLSCMILSFILIYIKKFSWSIVTCILGVGSFWVPNYLPSVYETATCQGRVHSKNNMILIKGKAQPFLIKEWTQEQCITNISVIDDDFVSSKKGVWFGFLTAKQFEFKKRPPFYPYIKINRIKMLNSIKNLQKN